MQEMNMLDRGKFLLINSRDLDFKEIIIIFLRYNRRSIEEREVLSSGK
jgi:hypothetical protein